MSDAAPEDEKLTGYHWRLFVFLGVATFFEGYDHIALSQILPEFRADMGIDETMGGLVVAVINVGTILAYLLVRQADKWGRRRVLTITIAGYTVFTFLTGLAPNVWWFAAAQFLARIFLIAEWAISMVYAAEDFPAKHRGLMIGLIQGFSSFGSIACAGLVPLLIETDYGWRMVYFVGAIPLVLLAVARRSLKESSRFAAMTAEERAAPKPMMRIWRTPYRKRVLQLALIWGLTYVCTATAIMYWKEYASAPAPAYGPHMDATAVGGVISLAAVAAMPLVFAAGKLLDWIGRRLGAVIIFVVTSASCVAAYTLTEPGPWLTLAVVGAIFGVSAVLPVLNAYNTELFPTHLRGDAFAWSNNILGRIGYVLAPWAVGAAAEAFGYGPAVAITAIGPILALILILWLLPETKGKELEETSRAL
ncbi:MAG: MFS transporter [Myxococcota bacterium]|nr:MFS transporter [Myxococcota bacterium]